MKTLVAVKVVPEPESVRFEPGLNRIVRQGVTSVLNPLDRLSFDVARQQRGRLGGEVAAVIMGPPNIDLLLRELIDLGADRIIHLCDPRFAGADTLATARALAQVLHREQADLLLCGRSAIDGGTAQTPAQVAQLAGFPFAASVIDLQVSGTVLEVVEEYEQGTRRHQLQLPAVVTIEAGYVVGDLPPSSGGGTVEVWDVDRLGGDEADYGIRGSRTYVQAVIDTEVTRAGDVGDCSEAVRAILQADRSTEESRPVADGSSSAHGVPSGQGAGVAAPALWVVAECRQEEIEPTALQGLACAATVAGALGAEVVAILLSDEPGSLPGQLAAAGADRVLVGTAPELRGQDPDVMEAALAPLVREQSPLAVIAPWSSGGRHYLPQVAASLGLGLVGDFVGLDVAPHPAGGDRLDLVWLKPAWAGTALARVVARTSPALGTLRPGAVRPLADRPGRRCPVQDIELDRRVLAAVTSRHTAVIAGDGGVLPLDAAKVILCIGSGVAPELAERFREVAGQRGWGFAGTAAAVACNLVPSRFEVSLVKRSIAPPVFVGIELDTPQDLAAVRSAGVIVAVGETLEPGLAGVTDMLVECPAWDFATALQAGISESEGVFGGPA